MVSRGILQHFGISATLSRICPDVARIWPRFGRNRPNAAEMEPNLAEIEICPPDTHTHTDISQLLHGTRRLTTPKMQSHGVAQVWPQLSNFVEIGADSADISVKCVESGTKAADLGRSSAEIRPTHVDSGSNVTNIGRTQVKFGRHVRNMSNVYLRHVAQGSSAGPMGRM